VLGAFQAPEILTGLGLDTLDFYGPSLSADGKTLYFCASDASSDDNIYVATRTNRGTSFSAATALDSINTTSDDGSPAISNDGLTLYFYSTRSGGHNGGGDDRDIWSASRSTIQGSFGAARRLAAINGTSDDNLQWLSSDELTIIFSSTRSGASDLYTAKRSRKSDDFSAPVELGGVNGTTSREDRAALSNDGLTLYFTSDRTGGLGDKDIWVATRSSAQGDFSNFTDLRVLNTTARDIDVALSADETELVFASKRSGQFRLYRSLRTCQ
jgi:Tol biopolymer transport system component